MRVTPFALGSHPLMDGMLTLMWFDDQPPVAYSEGMRRGKVYDSPAVVQELQGRYNLALVFPAAGWSSFVTALKDGRLTA
ncbi:hypothetical protein SALBM135S_03588 [Streptomyces alboniger]